MVRLFYVGFEACAVAGQSAATNYAWTVFIDMTSFNIDGLPNYIK